MPLKAMGDPESIFRLFGKFTKNSKSYVSHKEMKLLPVLTLAALMLTNTCSLAEKAGKSGPNEVMFVEVTWGTPAMPECKLRSEVSSDGLFAVMSKDGKHAAGGKVGTPNDKGYPVALTLFTWNSEDSHEMQSVEPRVKLGVSHEWATAMGLARLYSITPSRATNPDTGKPKKATEDATGQPATSPESNPKSGDKPKPKSEVHSR